MTTTRLRERVTAIVIELPEATATGAPHLRLAVRRKTFGYFLDDHHGDGIVDLTFKAAPGEQSALIGSDPDRFSVPACLGARGWAGLLTEAYRLPAPRKPAALEASQAGSSSPR